MFVEGFYFTDCNEAFLRMLGGSNKEDLLPLSPADISPEYQPDGRTSEEKAREVLHHVLQEGSVQFEWVHRRFDTTEFPVEVSLNRVTVGDRTFIYGNWRDISERKRIEEEIRIFKSLCDNAPDGIAVDRQGRVIYANASLQKMLGYDEEMIGMHVSDFHPEGQEQLLEEVMESVQTTGTWQGILPHKHKDGSTRQFMSSATLIFNEHGKPDAMSAIFRDISDLQRAEQERMDLKEQVIAAQQEALRELSTPLIPLSDHVVLLPLVGSIDTGRAQQVMETLLEGIAEFQADIAILDITGVSVVDTQVAQALLQSAQAVKLLGSQVVLTGIGPTMAQTLIHLGADLSSIRDAQYIAKRYRLCYES
ncbi:MAG: PAS domain S-box protein [Chloroflexaceae bacterium]|nr:PAS domain S-box protein [Chloroflexaceae bacterium]